MSARSTKTAIPVGLAVLALAQLAAIGYRDAQRPEGIGRRLTTGDDLSTIAVRDAGGHRASLATGEPALLLVFNSGCAQCARVAPAWRQWLDEHPDVPAFAVSREPIETAVPYVRANWPGPELRKVDVQMIGSRAHALISRTPWIFVVDGDGVVLADGVGDRIDELGSILAPDTGAPPIPPAPPFEGT